MCYCLGLPEVFIFRHLPGSWESIFEAVRSWIQNPLGGQLFRNLCRTVTRNTQMKEQNNLLKENNAALKENYSTLKELYEMTRAEAESSANEAKQNKIFGWVSFAVGTILGIAGIVIGIIV